MSIQSTEKEPLPAKLWNEKGELQRPKSLFRSFISNKPGAKFPAERDRYHLYVSYACPWAHRVLIVRKLKGLEDILPFTSVQWHMSFTKGWRFADADEKDPAESVTPDPLHSHVKHMSDLYYTADPNYGGRFTVPVIWDKKAQTIVNNESSEIIRMLYTEFDDLLPEKYRSVDLYPEPLRKEINETNEWTYDDINNGVYKCGMAKTQEAYEIAVSTLFASLDRVEKHLSSHAGPYYYGSSITEADVRLYVTIIRFDIAYHGHFKCNIRDIRSGYPAIHKWLRIVYHDVPAFKETTQFEHIKGHYMKSHTNINPFGIISAGPVPNILPKDQEVAAVAGLGSRSLEKGSEA